MNAARIADLLRDAESLKLPAINIEAAFYPRVDIRYGKLFTLADAERLRRLLRALTTG